MRRQDEGCWAERPAKLEHPSSAFAALRHLLPQGEKEEPLHCHGQSPPFEINRSADIAPLLLPLVALVGEGGRAGAKRRRGRMRGVGRSAARQAGSPLIRLRSQHPDEENEILYPRPFRLPHNRPIALTGTWCAPGIREGGGAGPVAWRKRGWKFSSEARARFAAPPHRQRPPRGPRRSGKTTGGALGRRHTFTLRGTDPAPRFPTAPDRESSLTMARPETGRGDGEACAQCSPHGLAQQAVRVRSGRRRRRKANDLAFRTTNARSHSEGPPSGH